MTSTKIRFVCISDTHNAAPSEGYTLPKGDVLIHAGDFTNQGSVSEIRKAVNWLEQADFEVKIIVAGNHDLSLDPNYTLKHDSGWTVSHSEEGRDICRALITSNDHFTYLQHTDTIVNLPSKGVSFKVFGSPYSPDRGRQNWAFQYDGAIAERQWDAVPEDADVVITHTPPQGLCDASEHWRDGGCEWLTRRVGQVRPRLLVCGHCHEGRGAVVVNWRQGDDAAAPGEDDTEREDHGIGAVPRWHRHVWSDPGLGSKKQSLLDLTGSPRSLLPQRSSWDDKRQYTAVVNASIMASSFGRGSKRFDKPIVVDMFLPVTS